MTSNFLPAAFAVILLVSASATAAQAQGYSGLIADDAAPSSSEKSAPQEQGGYGGLISSHSSSDSGGDSAAGYQGLMTGTPETGQTKKVTRSEKKKEQAAQQTPAPKTNYADEDPSTALARLQKASADKSFRDFKKTSVEKMRKMFPLSDDMAALLKKKYEEPLLPNGMTRNESIISKNIDYYMNQINQPDLSKEKRMEIAKTAYEDLSVLEAGMAMNAKTPEKKFDVLVEKGLSKSSVQTYLQGEKNAQARLAEALKVLAPLQAAK